METEKFIEKFVDRIVEKNLATREELLGCDESEINDVMTAQRVQWLPEIYKVFLRTIGKNAGKLWFNSYYSVEALYDMKDLYEEFIDDLSDDSFVFFSVEDVLFFHFHTKDKHPDPPVFGFKDPTLSLEKVADHLSEFLLRVY